MYIMRGLPGSGKSHIAHTLGGQVFSTDDFFTTADGYDFEPSQIGQAHLWNQQRVETAMMAGVPTIVVDNTNIMYWEMKPYIQYADKHGYEIEWVEAQSEWAWNAEECAKRNQHGVPLTVISNMLAKYQRLPERGAKEAILTAKAPWEGQ
jgi:predicted kinase